MAPVFEGRTAAQPTVAHEEWNIVREVASSPRQHFFFAWIFMLFCFMVWLWCCGVCVCLETSY